MGKQKGRERIVSIVLAFSMLLSMIGTPAFAVEGSTETSSVSQPHLNLHAGEGGSFIPDAKHIKVRAGDSAGIDIVPNEGYSISDVVVNGKSVGAVSSYLIRNIRKDYTISATFAKEEVSAESGVSGGTGETPKPNVHVIPETGGGDAPPAKSTAETIQKNLDDLCRDLADKRDAAINSLPESLTKAQRAELIDELNRIYEEAAKSIKNAKGVNEAGELFNKAVRDFEEVLSRFGVIIPSAGPADEPSAKDPFILTSALLALMAAILAVFSLRKRKEDEPKKYNRILTLVGAAGSIIIFLLTTGWNGVALANVWTALVAVGTGIALYGFIVQEKQSKEI